MSIYPITFDHDLYPGDLIALEFLKAVQDAEGDLTVGDTTAVGDFDYRTDATISTMITEAKAFWTNGVANDGSATAITGLSSSTPREYFDCFISNSGGGTGTWQYSNSPTNTEVTGANFAKALRGLYAEGGYTTLVSAIWSWLLAASSNSAYEHAADARNPSKYAGVTGTYNPKMALATELEVLSNGSAVNRNGSSLYDWSTLGILAPLYSARDLTGFADAKRQVSETRRRAYSGVDDHLVDRISIRGKSGLDFQVSFTETIASASRRVKDVRAAAIIGLAYREAPVIYVTRDHP